MTVLRLRTGSVRLLLVGAGHAHLEILRRLALDPLGVALTVVAPSPRHHYSGMVPGYLQGTYTEDEISVDVARLAERAGGRFVPGSAVGIDPARQTVRLADGEELSYDLVSFAVGSDSAGAASPEIAAHAQRVKPLARVAALRERLLELGRRDGERRVVVVGGGAAGVEVVFACAKVLDDAASITDIVGGKRRRLTIVDSGPDLLSGYTDRCRALARQLLAERGIEILTGKRVSAVHAEAVELEGGGEVPSDLTIWLTGAVAFPLLEGSGLPVDERGFLLLDDALRSLADLRIFAAGDCGTLACYPDTPKAGVYAVRQGPALWRSLKATLEGRQPPSFVPQTGFLSLLNTADGQALLQYKGHAVHSRWAFLWKDWIDRRFLRKYRA